MFYDLLRSIKRRTGIRTRASAVKTQLRRRVHGLIDRTYFKETACATNNRRKIIFHTTVWGDYLDLFLSYTVPSLLQDGNIPALARDGYDLRLDIYAHPQEYQEFAKKYGPCLARLEEYMPVKLTPLSELKGGWWQGMPLESAWIDQITRCLAEDAIMFWTPPDMIFGNWSITNAIRTVQGKNVCLAAAVPHVIREDIPESEAFAGLKRMERCIENVELVDLAFEYGHPFLLSSFDNQDYNGTLSGISIRKINCNTYSVIHNEQSVFVANFIPSDLKYFQTRGSHRDHNWPRLLLRHNRLKVVGSSDLFFCVEPNRKDVRVPIMESGRLNNDKFQTRRTRYLQQYVYNSFCCVWRGREVKP